MKIYENGQWIDLKKKAAAKRCEIQALEFEPPSQAFEQWMIRVMEKAFGLKPLDDGKTQINVFTPGKQ